MFVCRWHIIIIDPKNCSIIVIKNKCENLSCFSPFNLLDNVFEYWLMQDLRGRIGNNTLIIIKPEIIAANMHKICFLIANAGFSKLP